MGALIGMIGFVGLLGFGIIMSAVILADAFGHDDPDPAELMRRVGLAAKGMTDSGVPWIAGKTQAETLRGSLRPGAAEPRVVG